MSHYALLWSTVDFTFTFFSNYDLVALQKFGDDDDDDDHYY